MKQSKFIIITLISISLISLELIWTRIFSAEFFYTFAFLILSIAILGMGLGALTLRLFPKLNNLKFLPAILILTSLTALVGPPIVFKINLTFSEVLKDWTTIAKLFATIITLSSSFFFGGMALSLLFRKFSSEMPKMYMADLMGAGFGVVVSVILMNLVGTPIAAYLSSMPLIAASLILAPKFWKILPVGLIALMFFFATSAETILEKDRKERAPVIYKHWDAVSKIKVLEFSEEYRGIVIDNLANTPVYGFDGNWNVPDSMRFEFHLDVSYLINQFDSCTFLSLGAGGGADVLQALQEGATDIHAVEVIPHINEIMTEGDLADFAGNIYTDKRVKVVTEDARAYVRRFDNKFDVIFSASSNTFAALASGAFALAENYLFTTEAFIDYWDALSEKGFLVMEHQFYTERIVTEVMMALKESGVKNPKEHFAVYNLPQRRRKTILVSKLPLTDEIRNNAVMKLSPENHEYIHLIYPAPDSLKKNLTNRIILSGWENCADTANTDISPCTDDRPFIAQMGLWKNLTPKSLEKIMPHEIFGFPTSKILIVTILAVILIIVIPLNLLPYLFKGPKLRVKPWLYFFLIGMAFMIVEVVLILRYTLFIGPSIYSIITILLTLLIFSGIGSRYSREINSKTAFGGIIIWILLEVFIFNHLTYAFGGLTLVPRIIISSILIAPLGFFMGIPFPKGAIKVGELIDWGFAVNGAASVLGSTLILLIAFTFGLNIALLTGALLYGLAYLLILKMGAVN
jgi:spermidine synthase